MLASYIEEFPDIRKYWEQPAYHVLYLLHIGTVLVCDSLTLTLTLALPLTLNP